MERYFYNNNMFFYTPSEYRVNIESCHNSNIIVGIDDLQSLNMIQQIDRLIILGGDTTRIDFTPLYSHPEIKSLMLDYYETENNNEWAVDLSCFKQLNVLISNSSFNCINFKSLESLKVLLIKRWYHGDLNCISGCPIESLIVMSGLNSIDNYNNDQLRAFSVSYSKISRIASLSNFPKLEILEVDHCSKIEDWCDLFSSSIKVLLILGKNILKSVSFIDCLPNLSSFVLEGVVNDNNIFPLNRLSRCIITPHKRDYNLKPNELRKDYTFKTKLSIDPQYDYFKNRII